MRNRPSRRCSQPTRLPREIACTTSCTRRLADRTVVRMRRCLLKGASDDPETFDQPDLRQRRATEVHRKGGAELGAVGLLASVHECNRPRRTCRARPPLVAGPRAAGCRRSWSAAARRNSNLDQAAGRTFAYRLHVADAAPGDGAVVPVNGRLTWDAN